jgi:Domain of unknown function (DUF4915)
LSCGPNGPSTSVLRVPHPSGLTVDRTRGVVHIACSRNPNQVIQLAPSTGFLKRHDRVLQGARTGLVPSSTRYHPGCMYLHDLAIVSDRVLGNAVGMNAVVDLTDDAAQLVWWPRSIEGMAGPELGRNVVQLNSIAAGVSLDDSFFTASTAGPGFGLPGDADWSIDRQGVVFSGRTREPVVRGLTRPHSARLAGDGVLWVDDSGYGTLCVVDGEQATPVAALEGWTRGLSLLEQYAVVGTSRVLPRFVHYAPGLDVARSRCGVHLVELLSGRVTASLIWPAGNQVFAIDWIPSSLATGFLAGDPTASTESIETAWYAFCPPGATLGPVFE